MLERLLGRLKGEAPGIDPINQLDQGEIKPLPPYDQLLRGVEDEMRREGIDPLREKKELKRRYLEVVNSWMHD